MTDLKAGVYRHYKGPLYLVLGLAHDANADTLGSSGFIEYEGEHDQQVTIEPLGEREVVVYVGLALDAAHTGARLAVRTLSDFFAWVHEDGSTCHHQNQGVWCNTDQTRTKQRFTYLGPRLEGDML